MASMQTLPFSLFTKEYELYSVVMPWGDLKSISNFLS